jgi:hypothetical protein
MIIKKVVETIIRIILSVLLFIFLVFLIFRETKLELELNTEQEKTEFAEIIELTYKKNYNFKK